MTKPKEVQKESKDATEIIETKKQIFDRLNSEIPEELANIDHLSVPILVDED